MLWISSFVVLWFTVTQAFVLFPLGNDKLRWTPEFKCNYNNRLRYAQPLRSGMNEGNRSELDSGPEDLKDIRSEAYDGFSISEKEAAKKRDDPKISSNFLLGRGLFVSQPDRSKDPIRQAEVCVHICSMGIRIQID